MRNFDKQYLRMAHVWAENSRAVRLHVGALIIKGTQIISDGFNGTPSGFENTCEVTKCTNPDACYRDIPSSCPDCSFQSLVTKPEVLHAEANAIVKCAKYGHSTDGATLYVTDSPCLECAKLIIQSGIRTVVYDREYRITDGIDLLRRAGIKVVHLSLDADGKINDTPSHDGSSIEC